MNQENENKAIVRRAIERLNARDLDGFFELFTEDATSHEVYVAEPLSRGEFRAFLGEFLQAYPDARIETVSIISEGDTVAVENVLSATFSGEFRGTLPTHRQYQVREAVFFTLRNAKICTERIYLDQKSIESQLGIAG